MTVSELRDALVDMHQSLGNIQPVFNKVKFPEAFEKYYKKSEPVLMEIEKTFQETEDPEELLSQLSHALTDSAKERYGAMSRRKKDIVMMQDQLALVAFVFPCLFSYKADCMDQLAQSICKTWNETFHMTLKAVDYDTINNGFTRKWCYITTAVCDSLRKPDDCMELTTLRRYRDTYMAATENGRDLIRDYYNVAPTIVHKIDRREDAQQIYREIYDQYLVPCLESIAQGDNETCLTQYRTMVEDLEARYMYS